MSTSKMRAAIKFYTRQERFYLAVLVKPWLCSMPAFYKKQGQTVILSFKEKNLTVTDAGLTLKNIGFITESGTRHKCDANIPWDALVRVQDLNGDSTFPPQLTEDDWLPICEAPLPILGSGVVNHAGLHIV